MELSRQSVRAAWSRESLLASSHPSILPPFPPPLLSRLKEELEQLAVQVPAQAQSKREEGAGPGEAVSLGIRWQGAETACERSWGAGRQGGGLGSPQRTVFGEGHAHRSTAKAKTQRLAVVGWEGAGPREGVCTGMHGGPQHNPNLP